MRLLLSVVLAVLPLRPAFSQETFEIRVPSPESFPVELDLSAFTDSQTAATEDGAFGADSLAFARAEAEKAWAQPFGPDGGFDAAGIWFVREDKYQFYALLQKDGNGPYDRMQGGFTDSRFDGRVWTGRWFQVGNDREGRFKVTVSEDGRLATGDWWYTKVEGKEYPGCDASKCGGPYTFERVPPEKLPRGFSFSGSRPGFQERMAELGRELAALPRLDSEPYFGPSGDNDGIGSREPPIPPMWDPWEPYNRAMFKFTVWVFNNGMAPFARHVWIPLFDFHWLPDSIASGLRENVDLRQAIANGFLNMDQPEAFLASLGQGKLGKAGKALLVFLVNTTLGIGGLFNVAKRWLDIDRVNEDFGQMVGYWGVPAGPMVNIPFFAPQTLRDFVVWVAQQPFAPISFVVGFFERMALEAFRRINGASMEPLDPVNADEKYQEVMENHHKARVREIRR